MNERAANDSTVKTLVTQIIPFIAAVLFATFIYISVAERDAPIIFSRVVAEPSVVEDTLSLRVVGIRTRNCPVMVRERIIDANGEEHKLPDRYVKAPTIELGEADAVVKIDLPANLPPGSTVYIGENRYACNWFQRWVWPLVVQRPLVRFEVAP